MTRARDNSFNPFNNQVAGKNFIINGAFDHWQRGNSFSLSGGASTSNYTADRWSAGVNAGLVVSRVTGINVGSNYGLRMQRTAGNTNAGDNFVVQVIESNMVSSLAGQIVTLSFYLRKGADYSGAAVYCTPRFGTGTDEGVSPGYGSSWTGHNQIVHTVIPTTSSIKYTKTFTVPAGTKEMMLLMGPQSMTGTAGTNDWIEFEQIQLELGSNATQFSRAGGTIGGELLLCQRYYQGYRYFHALKAANAYARMTFNYMCTMRGTPSLAYRDSSANQSRITSYSAVDAASPNRQPLQVIGTDANTFLILPNNTDGDPSFFINIEASAEL